MKTSCGVLLTDGKVLLLCHVTNHPQWDIPKGENNLGESEMMTALRECKEETGLIVSSKYLKDLGMFDYLPNKNLHLFLCFIDNQYLPKITGMNCSSTFTMYSKTYPEVDKYDYISYSELNKYASKKLYPVLCKALNL